MQVLETKPWSSARASTLDSFIHSSAPTLTYSPTDLNSTVNVHLSSQMGSVLDFHHISFEGHIKPQHLSSPRTCSQLSSYSFHLGPSYGKPHTSGAQIILGLVSSSNCF